jgi:hypothetical protein
VEERGVEEFQHSWLKGDAWRACIRSSIHAREIHGPTGRVAQGTRREKIRRDTWQNAIGRPNFYLNNTLNLIISLQINFLIFIPKFMIFLSIN